MEIRPFSQSAFRDIPIFYEIDYFGAPTLTFFNLCKIKKSHQKHFKNQ